MATLIFVVSAITKAVPALAFWTSNAFVEVLAISTVPVKPLLLLKVLAISTFGSLLSLLKLVLDICEPPTWYWPVTFTFPLTPIPPFAVNVWLIVSAPWLVVVIPLLPIVMALALPVPIWTRPVVPVELPTSMATLPEAKAPDVTLPDVMLMAEVAAPDTLVVSRLVMPAPCRLSVPEVVDRVELALPVKDTAPPVTVTPALPVRRALKLLAPAQVWAPVLTKPGLVMSAQLKLMVLLLMLAPLA